jgi:hypothetical protein
MTVLAKANSSLTDWLAVNQFVERESTGRQSDETCSSWGWGKFGDPEEEERPLLEAVTKQSSKACDWEH